MVAEMTTFDGPEIGRRITAYRKLNGWTMQELATQTEGVSKEVIANVESGRRNDLTVRQLMDIAAALQVTPLALMFDLERPDEAPVGLNLRTWSGSEVAWDRKSPNLWLVMRWIGGGEIPGLDNPARVAATALIAATRAYFAAMSAYLRTMEKIEVARRDKENTAPSERDPGLNEYLDRLSSQDRLLDLHTWWYAYRKALELGIQTLEPPAEPEPDESPEEILGAPLG